MISVEAIMIDERRLELKMPFPEGIGKHYIIHIVEPEEERKETIRRLKDAYLSMTDKERAQEIELAEEGLHGQPKFLDQFANEGEEKWWGIV